MPGKPAARGLERYEQKRNFDVTSEPKPHRARGRKSSLSFVIQKHWASRLHYDFRLELDGVLVSWAVPKGPCFDPREKRMAVHVEDHPLRYGAFEGTIPAGQYGAGNVVIWDRGTWVPVGDPHDGLEKGKLIFQLHGEKLAGLWELVRISKPGEKKQDEWMLFKKKDGWARPLAAYDVVTALPDSIVEQPLGLLEDREAPARAAPPRPTSAEPDLSNAKKASVPAALSPQLATLIEKPPAGGDWIAETKFDGYRLLCRLERGKAKLVTRNGHDWTDKMPALREAVQSLGVDRAWLDGEIVVLDETGVPNFNLLQNALDANKSEPIIYFVFDAPFLGGYDLRAVPLWSRREALKQVFDAAQSNPRVRYSANLDAPLEQLLKAACQLHLEGVILKQADSPYVSDRTETWCKLKCTRRQEFVICGYTDRSGGKGEVGGLLLGYHDNGQLRYAGKVGTGWDHKTGRELREKLARLEVSEPAFDAQTVKPGRWSKRSAGGEHWVTPRLVAEITFAEWTPDGRIRHGSFKGLRADKPVAEIGKEAAVKAPARSKAAPAVTNPDRVIDPTSGLTKLDLYRYYESIADWVLPHLKNRPVSLVRAPTGITGELFFQKHPESRMPGLAELDPALWPGHAALLAVNSVKALLAAAQMNVVEFHTWNSTTRKIDKPDRVVFDLDPGEGVAWPRMIEAAVLVRSFLQELQLESWLKTSGGKGLHVVVPLSPRLDYDTVKDFSQRIVTHLAKTIPARFVAKSGPANRIGKIFVDYLRNGHAQTTAAAFSARARPGLGISMPVSWENVNSLKSGSQWTIANARDYLTFQKQDPWADYWTNPQTLTRAIKLLSA